MGQKVSPVGLRVGVNRNWDSRWYANDQDFAGLLHEDIKVRDYILKKLKTASVAKVEIERSKNRVTIFVHTSRPGVVIGKDGEAVDALRKEVSKLVSSKQVFINIVEIKNPDVVAQLVANNIAEQLENRASFRTVQKRAIQRAMRAGAKGIKTNVSGRLGGADMARAEGYSEGNVPLHTLPRSPPCPRAPCRHCCPGAGSPECRSRRRSFSVPRRGCRPRWHDTAHRPRRHW